MAYLTNNNWTKRLGALALMIALLTIVMTVTAQADGPEWKLPVTGLTAVAGNDPGEMIISWDAHTQTTKTFLNYRVAWTPQGESFKSADQTDWNAHTTGTQHTVTGLDAGASYQVKVRTRYEGRQGSRWTDVVTGQAGQAAAPTNSAATGQPDHHGHGRGRRDTHRGNLRHLRRQRDHERRIHLPVGAQRQWRQWLRHRHLRTQPARPT